MAPVALLVLVSACSPTTTPEDAALPRVDASRDAPISLVDGFIVHSDAPLLPGTDAGPRGPDARMPENCETPGDEDGDRLADCDDSDCWDGCAAVHVESELPGLVPCRDAVSQTAAESLAACRTTGEIEGDTPTECLEALTLTSTARFFCTAEDAVRAIWLDERVGFPPTDSREISATSRELTYYERSSVRDLARVSSPSSSGSTNPVLELSSLRTPTAADPTTVHRRITVFPIELRTTSFQRLVGVTRHVDIIMGSMRTSTSSALFRTGTVNLTTL